MVDLETDTTPVAVCQDAIINVFPVVLGFHLLETVLRCSASTAFQRLEREGRFIGDSRFYATASSRG